MSRDIGIKIKSPKNEDFESKSSNFGHFESKSSFFKNFSLMLDIVCIRVIVLSSLLMYEL